jgi:hypothetical protein
VTFTHLDAAVQAALTGCDELPAKRIALQSEITDKASEALLDEGVSPARNRLAVGSSSPARQPEPLGPVVVTTVVEADRLVESVEAGELELGAGRVRVAAAGELGQRGERVRLAPSHSAGDSWSLTEAELPLPFPAPAARHGGIEAGVAARGSSR